MFAAEIKDNRVHAMRAAAVTEWRGLVATRLKGGVGGTETGSHLSDSTEQQDVMTFELFGLAAIAVGFLCGRRIWLLRMYTSVSFRATAVM